MADAVQLATQSVKRGRQSKFTPERIQQIINLVERGKTRDEIAELVGVTTATLQVTCSKLGVSLRRRYFDTGVGLLHRKEIRSNTGTYGAYSRKLGAATEERENETPSLSQAAKAKAQSMDSEIVARPNGETEPPSQTDNTPNVFAIRMHYKGRERTIELPFSSEMVQKLAFEAEFRDMRIIELIIKAISHVAEKDLFRLVLDDLQAGQGKLHLVAKQQP